MDVSECGAGLQGTWVIVAYVAHMRRIHSSPYPISRRGVHFENENETRRMKPLRKSHMNRKFWNPADAILV